ncbi:glycosyltransferase family 87 protein [Rhizobium aegyptiacum]|uniref:glycosyltransferase family 87 protein n=1 Tax=Rhizobium aegyptiacum TaxID=1764550 RepID=UPI0007E5582D|nr:glycosyltransferase family 87 protein [Rhizobium aegyptiacum]
MKTRSLASLFHDADIWPPGKFIRLAATAGLALISLLIIQAEIPRVVSDHGLWDFGAFVASGRAAAAGLDPYGIYPPLTPHVVFPGFESWNPNLNPPISALLFQAFDVVDPVQSLRIWWMISIASYFAAVVLLLRRYSGGLELPLLAIWAFALAGFWDTLYLGQIYMPFVLLAVVAWLRLEKGDRVFAGIMIGLLISMKPNFAVWPVLLFLAGHRLPSVLAVTTAAVIAAIPLAMFGSQIYLDWLRLVATDGQRAIFLTNASFAGVAARAGLPAAGTVLAALLLLGLAGWAFFRRPPIIAVSGFALLASLLASPLGWIHYTLFLLPVLLHHWQRAWAWVAGAALTIPVPVILGYFGAARLTQLTAGSIYAWALVLILIGLIVSERDRQHAPAQGAFLR